jgi:hypothetical protein
MNFSALMSSPDYTKGFSRIEALSFAFSHWQGQAAPWGV